MLTHLYNRVTEMEGMKATGPEVGGRGLFFLEDVPLVEFMYLVFTCVPGESYRKRFRGLLLLFFPCYTYVSCRLHPAPPQWGAADAEIKVPSGENTELKRSPFQAWSRSVYSHACYAYCQGALPCLFLPF